ncbi:hypothetical protein K491DRAFT_595970, partial [Lophiostoma macrostomum CBS 122681]
MTKPHVDLALRPSNADVSHQGSVLIAVMGITGVGKSTFIQHVTQDPTVGVGHNLTSFTRNIAEHKCVIDGKPVTLVDLPGFDDTDLPDASVFTMTTEWLRRTYAQNKKLNGILYLYNINDVRMRGSTRKNLLMFSDLCGDTFLQDAIFVTTFWSSNRDKNKRQSKNLDELVTSPEFWKTMMDLGACTEKFYPRNTERALDIIRRVMRQPPLATQVQIEMVDQQKDIHDTTAGTRINEDLQKAKIQFQQELSALEQKLTK